MWAQLLGTMARATPARCEACHAWPSQPVCAACTTRFSAPVPRCRTCALAVPPGVEQCGRCLREPPPLAACIAAVSYGYPWAGLVARFKFSGGAGWASTFVPLMLAARGAAEALAASDLVVPMPLSRERLAARGYNQAHELARRLSPRRADATLALRVRDTAPQVQLAYGDRQANVRHAFAIEPARAREVRGAHVLLVDDVLTTGASLFALARVVREAGAAQVRAIVFARTEE